MTLRTGLRMAVLLPTIASTLGCLLMGSSHEDRNPSDSSFSTLTEAEPDGTTLWGTWDGAVACPSELGAIELDLAHQGGPSFAGPAAIALGEEVVSFTADVVYDAEDETVRDLWIQSSECDDCPRFEAVIWDMQTLPAVIDGEIHDLFPDEICTFELHATRD